MKPIAFWLESCRSHESQQFRDEHPLGFLLYASGAGPLVAVEQGGETLNRKVVAVDTNGALQRGSLFDVFELGTSTAVRIGSGAGVEVQINDQSVSALHVELRLVGAEVHVIDKGSTLGTQIAGKTLVPDVGTPLPNGAKLTVGSVDLKYLDSERFRMFVVSLLS